MPLYRGGQRIAKLYKGAVPVARAYLGAQKVFDAAELLLQYYLEGTEYVPWIVGYSSGSNGSQSKEADHLYLNVTSTSRRTWVTEIAIDLTPLSTLYVDWSLTRNSNGSTGFQVATNRDDNSSVTGISFNSSFARREDSLNVSALSGAHYIKIFANNASTTGSVTTRVYGVRGAP